MVQRNCKQCRNIFKTYPYMIKKGHGLFCSRSCAGKARQEKNWQNPEYRQHMKDAHKGYVPTNLAQLKEIAIKTHGHREKQLGRVSWNKGRKFPEFSGENNWNWIKDRTQLKRQDRKDNPNYKEWRINVYKRDSFKCKIEDKNCNGRIEAHHILPWRDFEELRYKVNNGITLCQFHHPTKRDEEKRLMPVFQELVLVSNV